MTFKVIRGQGQGQEMTSVPYRDYFFCSFLHGMSYMPPYRVCPSICKHLRKSLLLPDKWLDCRQTWTRWSRGRPAYSVCSRSRSRSKVMWYRHFWDFTKLILLPGKWLDRDQTHLLTSPSLSPFPFLLHPNPQMAVSLHCEFCHSSHHEAVCQTVCQTVWSQVPFLHVQTVWSTITLSFQNHYQAAESNV